MKTEVVLKVCFCRKTFPHQEVADLLKQRISGESLSKLRNFAGIRELQERKEIGNKSCKFLRTNGIYIKKEKAPNQRTDRSGEFLMGWLISFSPLALIAESSNLFSTNTINCGIGDFVTSSLKNRCC